MKKHLILFLFDNSISSSLSFILDSIMTFYLLKQGFKISEISLYFAISLLITTLIEFPSGIIADKYGRKTIYSLGLFCRALQCLMLIFSTNIIILFFAGIFEGIHNSFVSGSLDAWLLKTDNNINFEKLLSLNKIFTSILSIVLIIFLSVSFNNSKIYIVIFLFIYLIVSILNMIYLQDNKDKDASFRSNILLALDFLKNQTSKLLLLILLLFYGIISVYMLLFQSIVELNGYSDSFMLFLSLFSLLSGLVSGIMFQTFSKNNKKNVCINISLIGIIISFTIFVLFTNKTALLIGNTLYGYSSATLFPFFYSELYKMLPVQAIATNISAISSVASLFASFLTYILGLIPELLSLSMIGYIGIFFSICSFFIIKLKFKSTLIYK